jgi:hypothetical protein
MVRNHVHYVPSLRKFQSRKEFSVTKCFLSHGRFENRGERRSSGYITIRAVRALYFFLIVSRHFIIIHYSLYTVVTVRRLQY